MQNGFCHPKGSYGKMGYDLTASRAGIPAIGGLLAYFHARKLPVYYTKAIREASGIDCLDQVHNVLPASRMERIRKVPICVRGTWDADIVDELTPQPGDYIVEKRRDSAFQDTELELWLRALRVDTLVICGTDTYICVDSTLRDGFNRGHDVILVEDAVGSTRPDFHKVTIDIIREAFGLVMPESKLKAYLDREVPATKANPAA